ncbi:hypothetical protein [uncultured Roseivirga sp.]|uniref:hypothetical protein n=1 Tax=uncultured Roseivirga sp. TaxID=543088 RepID=UPI0030DD0AF7
MKNNQYSAMAFPFQKFPSVFQKEPSKTFQIALHLSIIFRTLVYYFRSKNRHSD